MIKYCAGTGEKQIHVLIHDTRETTCMAGTLLILFAALPPLELVPRKFKMVSSIDPYRKGLIMISYGLFTLPQIYRVYLIHSLAYNVSQGIQ